jgi:hypothetical protein
MCEEKDFKYDEKKYKLHESPIMSEEEVIYECSDRESDRERHSEFE